MTELSTEDSNSRDTQPPEQMPGGPWSWQLQVRPSLTLALEVRVDLTRFITSVSTTEVKADAEELPTDRLLLRLLISKSTTFHIDRTGEPCLILPNRTLPQALPIQHRQVRAYLARMAYDFDGRTVKTDELVRVLRALEGLAYENGRQDATNDALLGGLVENPLLQVIAHFMESKPSYEGQMSTLCKDLSVLAKTLGIDTRHRSWPKTPQVLSGYLKKSDYQETLKQSGIGIHLRRTKTGSQVKLQRLVGTDDDEIMPSSPLSSLHKPLSSQGIPQNDADDADRTAVLKQIELILPTGHPVTN